MVLESLGVLAALAALTAAVVGARRVDVPTPDWKALGAGVLGSVAIAGWLATERGPEIEGETVGAGLIVGAFLLGMFPLLLYWAIGRWLARRPLVLMAVWAVSIVPLLFYLFLALILVADIVYCPEDAYECPL
jgi:hypothetical protein